MEEGNHHSPARTAAEIFRQCGIKTSPVRQLVMRTLMGATSPLSSLQIETLLESVDRSSISRALSLFTEKGAVHTVDDGSGSVKYEVCKSCDSHHSDDDHHPHFHCLGCGTTICLDGVELPAVALPEGYVALSSNYVIKGYCRKCQAMKK